jgi:hypothetical protein
MSLGSGPVIYFKAPEMLKFVEFLIFVGSLKVSEEKSRIVILVRNPWSGSSDPYPYQNVITVRNQQIDN